MLGRYSMVRGTKLADMAEPLRRGLRVDTRMHTRHCLRPPREAVERYLAAPGDAAFAAFRKTYLATLRARHAEDPAPFEALAQRAQEGDVFIGCSCPTAKNPEVARCHTTLALGFMKERFPELDVALP